jgi:hypothetical protein
MTLTAARAKELSDGAEFKDESERSEFLKYLAWKERSRAAKRAVQTKRNRYKTWPTRKRDHI